ncbi:MAG: hypothetical protein LBJ35_06460 [Spirochaetaceae bacterium]|jgi:hypothetical protein|nr:hypothetical protein [Spirochaetaceae bacterium]
MIGFVLKKAFFDLWDNALRLAVLNIGFIASVAFFLFVHWLLEAFALLPSAVSACIFFLGVLWCSVYLAASAMCVRKISDYATFGFDDFLKALHSVWRCGIIYGLFVCIAALIFIFVIPFYLLLNSPAGLLTASLFFWTLIILLIATQYFFAIRARLSVKSIKIIKKSFLLFIDNPLFFIGTACLALLFFAVSILIAFLLPGPAGIQLFLDEALRLRLLKYDWLEQNAGADRGYIPWKTILSEERERHGKRSLRGLLTPWKD